MSKPRTQARKRASQALYMWQLSGNDLSDIDQQFILQHDMSKVDIKYFQELLHKIPAQLDIIDDQIKEFLDRPFEEIDPVETAILRIGVYELKFRQDIPYKVAINEAIEMAKIFGAEDGHKYVNSILDAVAKKLRSAEIQSKMSSK